MLKPLSSTELLQLRELLLQRELSFNDNGDNADIASEVSLEDPADQEKEAPTPA
jgi:hypothetical protein